MKYKENFHMELKREVTAELKKEIIAFANTEGGKIFIGIEDDGTIIGVVDPDDTMLRIGNMIRDGIKPDLTGYTRVACIQEEGKEIICIDIGRGSKRPYHLTDKGIKTTGVFVRHGVSAVPATDEMIRQMLRESDGVTYDKSRCLNQELTFLYAKSYFDKRGVALEDKHMRILGLVDNDGYYTNAALLLSDQCEHSIKCAIYDGDTKIHFKQRKEFNGSLLQQIEEAYEFLNLYNNLNSSFDQLQRVDHPDYPFYALREALLNAVVHRDYDYSASTIINLFDNKIEFISLGGLVKGITLEDILLGISQPRNVVLANIFYRLQLIESYGTGIARICESYEGNIEKPDFLLATASFVVILPKMSYAKRKSDEIIGEDVILSLLDQNGQIRRVDVEKVLGCSKLTAIKVINTLLEAEKIKKIGEGRAVRYIASRRGR